MVVRGEPGVGKSALLSDASSRAAGAQVLWTQGIESESPLAFAALHRLLRPVLPYLDRLPAPQARALRGAFGEQEGSVVDRLVVFVATLSLLSEAAEERPIIAVVDDAQWLDAASAEALLFVARRLLADRVVLVFGAREGDVRAFHGDGLPELVLGGLDSASAGALLTERAGVPVSAEVCAALVAQTGGSPLALIGTAHCAVDRPAGRQGAASRPASAHGRGGADVPRSSPAVARRSSDPVAGRRGRRLRPDRGGPRGGGGARRRRSGSRSG